MTGPPGPSDPATAGGLRVVLARHGQTPANVARTLDTRLPGPGLTDRGRRQAAALGAALAAEHPPPTTIAAVYSSAATRARETAGLVAGELGLVPSVVEGLQEVQVGELEGRNDETAVAEFLDVVDRWRAGEVDVAFDGGESATDLLGRFGRGLDEVRANHARGGTVVVVAHGAAIRLAAGGLAVDDTRVRPAEDHLDNCGYVVLAATGGGWRLAAWERRAPDGETSAMDATSG